MDLERHSYKPIDIRFFRHKWIKFLSAYIEVGVVEIDTGTYVEGTNDCWVYSPKIIVRPLSFFNRKLKLQYQSEKRYTDKEDVKAIAIDLLAYHRKQLEGKGYEVSYE